MNQTNDRDYEIMWQNVQTAIDLGWPDLLEEAEKLGYSGSEFFDLSPPSAEVWLKRAIAEIKNDRTNIIEGKFK